MTELVIASESSNIHNYFKINLILLPLIVVNINNLFINDK